MGINKIQINPKLLFFHKCNTPIPHVHFHRLTPYLHIAIIMLIYFKLAMYHACISGEVDMVCYCCGQVLMGHT